MRKLFYVALLAIGVIITSCKDDDEPLGSSLISVPVNIKLDSEFQPLDINVSRTKAQVDMQLRFVVELWRDGVSEQRHVVPYDLEEGENDFILPLDLKLEALDYDIMVWADYVERGSIEDYFYNTTDLSEVVYTEPYKGSTDYKACFYGKASLDLSEFIGERDVNRKIIIDMVRPQAKYQIIATDVDEFLTKTSSEGGEYTARFSYGFYIPMGYYLINDAPINSKEGVYFTTPIIIERNEANEVTLGSDFIFAGGVGSFTILNIDIMDSSGKVISRAYGIEIPYEYKHLTTLRARVLTNEIADGGVGFDPEWEDELDFDLDELF